MPLFQTDSRNKAFIITIEGFAEVDRAADFVGKLKNEVSTIDVNNYTLIADGTHLKTFKPEILPLLEKSYALYMSLGFKKVLVVNPQRVTPRLQVKRVAKNVQFTGEFIPSLQEALHISANL
ncbi:MULTISPECIES: hypothetical protein [Heyndrickxia]|jgi:hypothetical protein|uniref:Uncharacterized protein n=1 Tax=Heyndrickxia oleronia TaxID=38875 RepID=A0A8E2I840_9BACI|nr:hypothetical protein [Heyndrickxia oleronia]NYV63923.1 hypothetical protein [Bacillus sp. Gen3]OJH16182.1 hypothetical protein BLX88_24710 [Bacillus obstructivus]MBU5212749.1 hypothetical protein [Heyndrickxia oleronia]MCI1590616.1 hypothetical protein [Heyndrickxia oleronia]MCI1614254.1 hypothetical protein [Heyndrickxia oleronia]